MPALSKFWRISAAYLNAIDRGMSKEQAREHVVEQFEALLSPTKEEIENKEQIVDAIVDGLVIEVEPLEGKDETRFRKVRSIAATGEYDLWKYFEDRADQIKERLWTTATWLISVQAAFLTVLFGAKILQFGAASPLQFSICLPIPAFLLCLFGVCISAYSRIVIIDAASHVTKNWRRANQISEEFDSITPYGEFWGARIPLIGCWLLGFVFLALSVTSALQYVCQHWSLCLWDYSAIGSCLQTTSSG